MRLTALAVVLVGLAACEAGLPGGGTRSLGLYDGSVRVAGPEGYCVDPLASRPEAGFAVLGACGLLGGSGGMPGTDGFITVQAGAAGTASVSGSETDLATLLRLPMGAALLTDSGRPATVAVGLVEQSPGLVIVQFTDRAPPPVDGLAAEEWRAFMDLGGRLVTVGLRGYDRAPLSAAQARGLLYATVAALRAANPAAAAPGRLQSGNGSGL